MPEQFVYDWLVSRRLLVVGTALLAVASLVTGLVMWSHFQTEAAGRLTNGSPVSAQVTGLGGFGIGRAHASEVTLTYTVADEVFSTRLMSIWTADGSFRRNEHVLVYADRADPHRVATEDDFVSEDRLVLAPYALWALATCLVIFLVVGLVRRRSVAIPVRADSAS